MGQDLLSLSGCGNTPASSSRDKSRSGFEIPEETALGLGFEGFHLCFNVTASVVLVILYQEQEPTYVLPGNVTMVLEESSLPQFPQTFHVITKELFLPRSQTS